MDSPTDPGDRVLHDIARKIDREKVLIQGAKALRNSTPNPVVQQKCDTNIRESQKNIEYLEERLRQLQIRKRNSISADSSAGPYGSPTNTSANTPGSNAGNQSLANSNSPASRSYSGQGQYESCVFISFISKVHLLTIIIGTAGNVRPNFTRLDLMKYDSPYLGPRIQTMLQQIEFKLSVEKQYKEGIEKMIHLYQIEGDRRSKAEAESKRLESTQKIQLLAKSRKRYNDMHIDFEEEEADDESMNVANLRRPLTGNLHISCLAVKDVDHIISARPLKNPESMISVKVEDQTRAKTKLSRNDRWNEEFDISVDKANEIEITVYDKFGDQNVPVGLMWLRISDIAEAIRRRRVEQELNQAGWVSASKVQANVHGGNGAGSSRNNSHLFGPHHPGGSAGPAPAHQGTAHSHPGSPAITIDSWFVLEPAGQIHLSLGFEKASRGTKRPYDGIGGLGRQGAIRQKKEEVHEMHGHQFVQQQFYNIMKCALCGDFLKYAGGYQCLDCKYTCHKKCYPKVVIKCISRASTETDPDEEKLNHRIPHRFEPTTNMGANWCCHCGYILPLGKKNVRKCTECGSTCHAQCVHLVPDFCGMSMEVANRILSEIKLTKDRKAAGSARPANLPLTPNSNTSSSNRFSVQTSPTEMYSQGLTSPTSNQRAPPSPQQLMHNQIQSQYQQHPQVVLNQPIPSQQDRISPVSGTSPGQQRSPVRRKEVGSTSPPIPSDTSMTSVASHSLEPTSSSSVSSNDHRVSSAIPAVSIAMSSLTTQKSPTPFLTSTPSLEPQTSAMSQDSTQSQSSTSAQETAVLQEQIKFHQQPSSPTNQHQVAPTSPDSHSAASGSNATGQVSARRLPVQQAQPQVSPRRTRRKVGLDDFNFLAVLGKGNFGKVMLAESRNTKKLCAIKVLKKDFIIENDEVESTRSEKRVFLIANRERHPFLLSLHSCFQTENRVYFVMEYISGGDLMWHIQQVPFTPRRAQFYAAEVLLGLKYFHENGVIYRDLKLDNILLTLSGHIKIADYGLCKEEMWYGNTTGTFCGTPEFMAPEILLEQKYGRGVDWWAFGVLIYQMLLGQSPFRGEDDDEVFDAILLDEPLYPIHMPRDSVSILQGLLTREPENRLGSGSSDAEEIMAHDYFKNINFDDIYHCRVPPPYVPQIDSPTDVKNFDQEFTNEVPALTPVTKTLTPAMQEQFRGFSYLNGEAI